MRKIGIFLVFVLLFASSVYAQDLTDADCGSTITEDSELIGDMTCSGTGIFIGSGDITLDCQGHSITYAESGSGDGINVTNYENIIIENCEFIEDNSGTNNYGIYVEYSGPQSEPLGGDMGYSVRLQNNIISSNDDGSGSVDLGFENADYVLLYNQSIASYDISNSKFKVSDGLPGFWFNKTGLLIFKEDVTESGTNLDEDIVIENNLIQLDSSKTGFNVSARLVFYEPDLGCGNGCPAAGKDGSICEAPFGDECTDVGYSSENESEFWGPENYAYNVTHLIGNLSKTNYSLIPQCTSCEVCQPEGPGSVYVFCGDELNGKLFPQTIDETNNQFTIMNSLSCDNSALDVNGLTNATINFDNHNYEFGILGESDYGIEVKGINDDYGLRLTNFIIIQNNNVEDQKALSLRFSDDEKPIDLDIQNFTIQTESATGIWITGGENLKFSEGYLEVSNTTSILIKEDGFEESINITLNNLTIVPSKCDLNVSNSQVNLVNQSILNYTFSDANITVINNDGRIKFNELITETGENLNNDIQIRNNFVSVDSTGSNGLNVSAEITLYDVHIGQGEARVLKDGEVCDDCGALVREGNDFTFTVTGFSNYTIDSSMCGWYVNESSVLNESLDCDGTGLIINASDIVLDCDGFNITYGRSGVDSKYGIFSNRINNVTIQNCNFIEGNTSGNSKHGIYFSGPIILGELYNNTLHLIGDESNAIRLESTFNMSISDNLIFTQGNMSNGIYVQADSGEPLINHNIYNNIINVSASDSNAFIMDSNIKNVTIENNYILQAGIAFSLGGGESGFQNYNKLINNSVNNVQNEDLLLDGTIGSWLWLINQEINEYSWYSYLIIENTDYGKVEFDNDFIPGGVVGDNLSEDIKINPAPKWIYVDGSQERFNQSSKLSFYNTGLTSNVRATRNDELCEEYCGEITQNGDNYSFNVTGFSSYGLTTDAFCDEVIDWNLNQSRNLACDGTAWHIGADNIVIDCQGHNITYGNSSFGYGINNSGYNNVTIKNCNFIEGSGSGTKKHAINFENVRISNLFNNTITTTNTGYGINLNYGTSNTIENNTIITEDDDCYGIKSESNRFLNIKGNTIYTYGDSFESSAIKISESNYPLNSYVSNNIINTDGQNAYGVHLYDDINIIVENNDIETSNSGSINVYLEHADNNIIKNNSAKVTNGASAFYIYGHSDNNLIENNTVEQSRIGIELEGEYGDYPDNNIIKNNDLQTITQRDIVIEEDVTNTWLINQSIERYFINEADLNIKNNFGIIDFTEKIDVAGENLDQDLILEENNIGTEKGELDKSANLTFYNIEIFGTAESKLNGDECPDSICSNLVNYSCSGNYCNYNFSVTGFSNYSVGEQGVDCGEVINTSISMVYGLPDCSENGLILDAEGITLDCRGNNITYGFGGSGKGLIVNEDHIEVKNCTIIERGSGTEKYGIFSNSSNNINLLNNNITTNQSSSIYIRNSNNFNLSNNIMNSSSYLLNIYGGEGIVYGDDLLSEQSLEIENSEEVIFVDLDIMGYSINNSKITIEKTNKGKLEFIDAITGQGSNLSEDIVVDNNLVYVNSSLGENKSANVELYNLDFNGTVDVLRDDIECQNCGIVYYNNSKYYFNVTGFSNYSLFSEPIVCGETIYNTLYLNKSLNCNETAINIGADNVVIDCQGYNVVYGNGSFGYGLNDNEYDNFILRNCNLFGEINSSHTVYSEGDNGEIYNNNIVLINGSGIYFNQSNSNTVWNNTFNSSSSDYVIESFNSSSNNLENNTIIESERSLRFINGSYNILKNNSINAVNDEINISNSDYNLLFSQQADEYDIKGIVYFENNYGKIYYNEALNQTGINLSSDINITNNLIEVAEKDGLNKSANLEFKSIILGEGESPIPYKNGYWCPGSICSGFEANDNDYSFNVTGFSNYTIHGEEIGCGQNIWGSVILYQDITCGSGLDIGADNVVLDCNWYTIFYGSDHYGINNSGYDNITIKNCNLEQVNFDFELPFAIYFNNTENGLLQSNTFTNLTTKNVYVQNSTELAMKYCGAANFSFINSTISFENNYGKIDFGGDVTASGGNLSQEMSIEDNLISVESWSELNNEADLSFYNLDIDGVAYAVKDNSVCEDCGPVTKSGNDYFFTVSGFSNYSVGDNISEGGDDPELPSTPEIGTGSGLMGDFYPPVIGSPFPVGKVYLLMPTLSIVTDEVATCRWDFNDISYGRMENNFEYLGHIHVWNSVENWDYGNYEIYAKCRDANGNINANSYTWTFSIVNESECGNGICEDDEDFEICPEDCEESIVEVEEEYGDEEDKVEENKNIAGQAYSIMELIQNSEIGSLIVYFIVGLVLIGGYLLSHKASSWVTGDIINTSIEKIKPELSLSAKKIKYRLMNDDVYNATLEYLHMKELFNKIPKKYKEERKYLYSYMVKAYNKIQAKVEEINNRNN